MDPPFYVLSSGDESSDSNSPNTSLSGSSHDTSSAKYHIQDVKAFAEDLNQAAKSAFPNRGRSRYDTANACLIRWEQDELNVHPELNRLNDKFQDYGFATNTWLIPSRDSHLELMSKAIDLIRASDNDRNLFIVYYAGHGRINSARQAEWTCNQDPNYASVDWSAIQSLFAKAKSDVLILLDTCAAASSTMRSQYGVMEAIVACGFESRAAPPGEYSFTNTLIEVLDDWQNKRSFSASCLHAEILFQLKLKENRKGREGVKLEWCSTPIHINYTHDSKAPGIELCRRNVMSPPANSDIFPDRRSTFIDAMDLDVDDTHTTPSPILSLSASGEFQTPQVLIRIGLEQQQPLMDVKQCLRWLENIPILGKWATIEGVYPSYSTLLIISVPIVIWNMLPDNPACSFIGYVTAPSFTRNFPEPNTPKTSSITAVNPGYSDSFESRMIETFGKSSTALSGSALSDLKGEQRYLEPMALPTPPTSVLDKPRDFRKGEPNNKPSDKSTLPIDSREIVDAADAGGLEKSEHIVQSSIPDAPAGDDDPTKRSSMQTTEGTAWNQFSENEQQFGITEDYDKKIETTKITPTPGQQEDTGSPGFKGPTEIMRERAHRDQRQKEEREAGEQLERTRTREQAMALEEEKRRDKSQSGHEQRALDCMESIGNDPVSQELIARITEKVKRELFELLKEMRSGGDTAGALPLHRAPSHSSSSTSSPPPTARRVHTPPHSSSPTHSPSPKQLKEYPEDHVFAAWRKREPQLHAVTYHVSSLIQPKEFSLHSNHAIDIERERKSHTAAPDINRPKSESRLAKTSSTSSARSADSGFHEDTRLPDLSKYVLPPSPPSSSQTSFGTQSQIFGPGTYVSNISLPGPPPGPPPIEIGARDRRVTDRNIRRGTEDERFVDTEKWDRYQESRGVEPDRFNRPYERGSISIDARDVRGAPSDELYKEKEELWTTMDGSYRRYA